MKRILFLVLQVILFSLVFLVGSFVGPLHIQHVLSTGPNGTRVFIWDGVILMFAVYALILIIEAARKRLMQSSLWTTLALALAAAIGFALKFGFVTHDRY